MSSKEALEYADKYNNLIFTEDFDWENERPKYSCDGCDQNYKALAHAFDAGLAKGKEEGENVGIRKGLEIARYRDFICLVQENKDFFNVSLGDSCIDAVYNYIINQLRQI